MYHYGQFERFLTYFYSLLRKCSFPPSKHSICLVNSISQKSVMVNGVYTSSGAMSNRREVAMGYTQLAVRMEPSDEMDVDDTTELMT
ncbi:hypothetical protein TSAR_015549 [Trichomalopsis sarcophagae]|uniref:Uncharacterized protein n=1 Tax=Trichomalopsis sarcophagae TaxID=543379 RepID=A0A232FC39_9HYME|nr:hypothetical protein TSAR_015549 [Trichomalopsis sarcophagae]